MTSSPTDTSENQSFLSKLRERSAIVFTIGLAISVASFVENLHMGKDAIAYVVAELSKIEGWADAVRAVAAIFHGALEWWRGVLRDLFSFLPFEIPQWMHDPLSVLFFGIGGYRRGYENSALTPGLARSKGITVRLLVFRRISDAALSSMSIVLPLVGLTLADKLLYGTVGRWEIYTYISGLMLLVAVASLYWFWVGMRRTLL